MENQSKALLRTAPLLALLAGIFWGSEGSFVRVLTGLGMNNITILGTRLSGACIMLLIIILITDRSKLKIDVHDLLLFILTGFFGSVALNFCYNEAINRMTLSLAAVLLDLCPVYTIIIAFFVFREKITKRKIFCLILAIAGCILVSGLGTSNTVWTKWGLIFGFLSGIFYALYGLISKGAANKGYSSTTMTFYMLLTSSIMCLPFTNWSTAGEILTLPGGRGALLMFFNSLCCSLLPYLMFAAALTVMDAGKTGIFTTIEPAAAMFLGFLLFDEVPTPLMILGMAVVIAALVILNLPDRSAAADTASPSE